MELTTSVWPCVCICTHVRLHVCVYLYVCVCVCEYTYVGGGGLSSLRYDRQGKAYAQMLLSKPIQVPRAWLSFMPSLYTAKL
jgi:hypothetical protein